MTKPNTLFKEAYNACLDLVADHPVGSVLPSETDLGDKLKISRTTVRSVLTSLSDAGIVQWERRAKTVLRPPVRDDYFAQEETNSLSAMIERSFMRRILSGGANPGDQINELELARDLGVSTSAVREFLIRFSRFGLIEKRRNSHWVLKGFTRDFALELTEVREMFELRSATAFAQLPADHPAWTALDAVEAEHLALAERFDDDWRGFSQLDEKFHRMIHEASRNRFIIDFYDVIAMIFHYHYQWNKADEKRRNRVAVGEHLDYIAALKRRSMMDVEFYCRKHLLSARETLLQSIAL